MTMASSRLHSRDAELAAAIAAAPEAGRAIALFAAEAAIASSGISAPEVIETLRLLTSGQLAAAVKLRPELERLTEELEKPYFKELAAGIEAYVPLTPTALAAFRRARAVNALSVALAEDPVDAALEATYEAQASFREPSSSSLLESIKERLRHGRVGPTTRSE